MSNMPPRWSTLQSVGLYNIKALAFLVILGHISAVRYGETSLVYQWSKLEFDWPSDAERAEAISNGTYTVEKNLLAGIKIYKNVVYLTIPRWRSLTGIPATLARVVEVQGQAILRPYPDWSAQRVGDCHALQYVQSMEIDPNTGLMYVLDTGRIGLVSAAVTPANLCPAKIVVYDLNTDEKVDSYDMPADVVSRNNNFMNDIVLDYIDGKVRYAYISDPLETRMYAFDFETRTAHDVIDTASMTSEDGGSIIRINSHDYTFDLGLDGIAMSPDFNYVYYCPLGGFNLYQIPTSTLRSSGSSGIELVGRKISQSDGLAFSNKRLYYGALGLNAIFSWDSYSDGPDCAVTMNMETEVVRDDKTMQWPDTFGFDNEGWLWFVSNRLQIFFSDKMDFSGTEINMRVWKVYINETSYLDQANIRTLVHPVVK